MLRSCVAPSTSCQTKRQLPWDQDAKKNINVVFVYHIVEENNKCNAISFTLELVLELAGRGNIITSICFMSFDVAARSPFATRPLSTHTKRSSGHAKPLPRQLRRESQRTKICQDMPRYPSAWTGWLCTMLLGARTCHQQNSWGLYPKSSIGWAQAFALALCCGCDN